MRWCPLSGTSTTRSPAPRSRRGGVLRAGAGARRVGLDGPRVPLTVDGLIYASSMVMLDSARRKVQVPALARWLLGLGIAATLAANVAHGLGHGLAGAAVAACPAVALAGSCELLRLIIGNAQAQPDAALAPECLTSIHSRCRLQSGLQSRVRTRPGNV